MVFLTSDKNIFIVLIYLSSHLRTNLTSQIDNCFKIKTSLAYNRILFLELDCLKTLLDHAGTSFSGQSYKQFMIVIYQS